MRKKSVKIKMVKAGAQGQQAGKASLIPVVKIQKKNLRRKKGKI